MAPEAGAAYRKGVSIEAVAPVLSVAVMRTWFVPMDASTLSQSPAVSHSAWTPMMVTEVMVLSSSVTWPLIRTLVPTVMGSLTARWR